MIVRRCLAYLLAAVLGAGTAALAACGDGTKNGIPAADASSLKSDIDDVRQRVEDARCEALAGQLRQVITRVDRLDADVDAQLRERLREGYESLRSKALSECDENRTETETQTTTTETQTTPETQTQTTPPETQTTPPETTTTPPPTSTTPPVPVAPPPPAPPGGGTPPEVTP